MQNGAASAMLLGVTLTSTIIPILGLLPRSAARSPKSAGFQRTSTATSAHCSSDSASSVASPRLSPERSNAKIFIGREQPTPTKGSGKAFSSLIGRFSHIPFDHPLYLIFLAIMVFYGLAMDVRGQLRLASVMIGRSRPSATFSAWRASSASPSSSSSPGSIAFAGRCHYLSRQALAQRQAPSGATR